METPRTRTEHRSRSGARPGLLTRRRLLTGTGAAAAVVAWTLTSSVGCAGPRGNFLRCRHQRTGEIYADLAIAPGSRITHSWVHSIELSRWSDTFVFDGEGLMLVTTEFQEYGAGMPLDEGDVTIRDGTVVIENIDRPFDAIRWIHSHRVDYRIGVDGNQEALDTDELPDGEPLELRIL